MAPEFPPILVPAGGAASMVHEVGDFSGKASERPRLDQFTTWRNRLIANKSVYFNKIGAPYPRLI
jgi:hypothetical protein